MRYAEDIKMKARLLRSKGFSLDSICNEMHIPRTTIMSWISDVSLSDKQIRVMRMKALAALQKGRVRTQKANAESRKSQMNELLISGKNEVGVLSDRELFIAGIALYWAEGFKNMHEHRLGFCNSDPAMIKFYLFWLQKILKIDSKQIVLRLTVNILYKNNSQEIQQYWSQLTEIPLCQFTKTFFQNSKWKKKYNNDNYKGVLRIHVKSSLGLLWKMRGQIAGLKENTRLLSEL